MNSQSISAMTVNPSSLPSAKKKGSDQEESQDFLTFMNQNMMSNLSLPNRNGKGTESYDSIVTTQKTDSGGMDFARNSSAKAATQIHETQTSSGPVTEDQVVDAKKAMKGFEADVKKAVTEELSITEEELEEAMNALGISYADLLDVTKLKDLLLQISGQSDPSVLLVSDSMKDLFLQITSIAQEDLGQLPLDQGQWQLVENQGEVLSDTQLAELLARQAVSVEEASGVPMEESNTTTILPEQQEDAAIIQQPVAVNDDSSEMEASDEMTLQEDELAETALHMSTEESSDETSASNDGQETFSQGKQQTQTAKHTASDAVANTNVAVQAVTANAFEEEMVSQVNRYSSIDTEDVISQIIREAKTNITSSVRTMEMELNPQSLGHLFMQVTEKNGDITARLFAQDEAVKHALENRLADLQEKLKEAGIKVNEISIAVGTHAFEENLEKGNTQQQMTQDQTMSGGFAQGDGRENATVANRSLDLSADGELPSDMTEAEKLEASIMKDLGNTVSYMA
ncbi:MAG: flagellar hook-length control protein FliK [Lachnospiraceae bacterium]|nr:flagellar hook-length control protein FliK [Lachnospiraceae bacterium]